MMETRGRKMKMIAPNMIAGVVAVALGMGCSTTRTIKQNEMLHFSGGVPLVLADGGKISIMSAQAAEDSLIVVVARTHREFRYHSSDIQGVVVKKRGKGFWQGLLLGAAGGAVLGYIAGDSDPTDPMASRGVSAFLWGYFGGGAGALVGTLRGSREVYILQ